jgi:hypothetical protein
MYENLEEIPGRLRARAAGRAVTRTPANPPPSHSTPEGHPIEPEDDDCPQKHPDLPEEDVLSPGDGEAPVDNGGQGEASVSPEEIRAALTIEAAYCRVMARKKEVLNGIRATRARIWALLHDRASSMEWPRRKQYRLLMQGPLVHVLVCLYGIKTFADRISKDSKRRLQGDGHKRLEELIERSDRSR